MLPVNERSLKSEKIKGAIEEIVISIYLLFII
jgi:hypothetical protein